MSTEAVLVMLKKQKRVLCHGSRLGCHAHRFGWACFAAAMKSHARAEPWACHTIRILAIRFDREAVKRLVATMFAALLVAGCDVAGPPNSEPPPTLTAKPLHAPKGKPGTGGDKGATGTTERNFNGAVFQIPGDWEEVPKQSEFIAAEFQVPGPGGPARLTLSTARGGVAENIERWKGQFLRSSNDPPPKEAHLTIDGREATLVELFGSYQDMLQPRAPQTGSALLGVVIPLRETNYFVKLTGPRETVLDVRESFLEFAGSARFKE
jgi:hypothetical protein